MVDKRLHSRNQSKKIIHNLCNLSEKLQEKQLKVVSILEIDTLVNEFTDLSIKFTNDLQKINALKKFFFEVIGFKVDLDDPYANKNFHIADVLERKKGSDLCICAIFLYFLTRCGFCAHIINLNNDFLIAIEVDEIIYYFDVKEKSWLTNRTLKARFKGAFGTLAIFDAEKLTPASIKSIESGLLNYLKISYSKEKKLEKCLKVLELLLELKPGDPFEIKERGILLQKLNCYSLAAKDYKYFISRCPEDPSTEILKRTLKTFSKEQVVYH